MAEAAADGTGQGTGGLRADGALLGITAVWALMFLVVKDALAGADPLTFLALRFGVGAAALTLVARRPGLSHGPSVRRGLLLAPFLFLGFALQTAGLALTTPSRAAFITGLFVVLVPFVSLALFRRPPRGASLLGVVLATGGLWVMTLGGGAPEGAAGAAGGDTRLGDGLTLGCAVAFAVHTSLTERYAPGARPTVMVAVQLWVVAALAALCLPFVEVRLTPSAPVVLGVLASGVLASALAISVQTWAQARTSAVRAALIFSLEPVLTTLASVALGREVLGEREWLGGGLVVLAILVSEVGNAAVDRWRRAREAAAPALR
jgi:drug/metabolite transporter (DMT)-like permease